MKVCAVVPTCRGFTVPEQSIDVSWIIVHDGQEWPVTGEAAHIVAPEPARYSRKNSCIRGAGFVAAYKTGASFILTTDDDVFIPPDWAETHVRALSSCHSIWNETIEGVRTRGLPYQRCDIPVGITHGLWDGELDLDSVSKLAGHTSRFRHANKWQRIFPPFPMSNMNLGFTREVALTMFEFPMGPDYLYDRFEDIWMGLVAQRILIHHGYAMLNGGACVYHVRASDPYINLAKEANGIRENESFWKYIQIFDRFGSTIDVSILAMAEHVAQYQPVVPGGEDYFRVVGERMTEWVGLLEAP